MKDDVCLPSSCKTSWFRQRSMWWLKTARSWVSWVSWHTGQTKTGPLLLDGFGSCEVAVLLSSLINETFWTESFFTLLWPFWGLTFDFFSWASCRLLSLFTAARSSRSFFRSDSDSVSDSVPSFVFWEALLRHWSICVLKTFRSVVSTFLKHMGHVRVSDSSQADVDACACTGLGVSERSGGKWLFSLAVAGVPVLAITGAFSPLPSFFVAALAASSCSLLTWALWKKDCWSPTVAWLPSVCLCLLRQGRSSCLWCFCSTRGHISGEVWKG